jgi:serine/threonine protein kinase
VSDAPKNPKKHWKQLLELLETYFELEEPDRQAHLEKIEAADPALRDSLRKLIAQREQLIQQEFLAKPASPGLSAGQRITGRGSDVELLTRPPGGFDLTGPGGTDPTRPRASGQSGSGGSDLTGPGGSSLTGPGNSALTGPAGGNVTGPGSHLTGPGGGDLTGPGGGDLTGPGGGDLTGPGGGDLTGSGGGNLTGPGGSNLTGPGGSLIEVVRSVRFGPARVETAEVATGCGTAQGGRTTSPMAQPSGSIPPPDVGMMLGGNFTLLEELGHGGMGRVFKAEDGWARAANDSNPYVALKVLNPDFERHPDAVIALQREAKRAHTLAHPNVVTVYQFERDGPYSYITMEYLCGRTLDVLLANDFSKGVPHAKAWAIIRQVCAALEYGHTKVYENKKGIVHSDLKPSNVFVCNDGTVKVLDFGISRPMAATENLSDATHFDPGIRLRALTEAYAALEMWNPGAPDPRDDIYALGCVTYELLTGRHPFTASDPVTGEPIKLSAPAALAAKMAPARIESLDRRQWDALRKTLAFRRADRTPSVATFMQAFQPRSFLRRHAKGLIAAGALAVAGVLTVGAWSYRSYIQADMDVFESAPTPRHVNITAAQGRQIADYLAQAKEALGSVKLEMSGDELAYVLTDGVNNVDEILKAALAIQPDNSDALDLEARIARLYEQKARAVLEQGAAAAALTLVRNGLKAQPYDRGLRRLQKEICKRGDAVCASRS